MDAQGSVRIEMLRRKLLLALLAVAVACAWLRPLDDLAGAQAQAGFKRAVASFATARALNAVISVVQGTELSVQPLGVGVTLTPGQMLDPLNDLVERFSDLMLAASVAFGVQLLLIEVGMHWGMSLALTLVAFAWPKATSPSLPASTSRASGASVIAGVRSRYSKMRANSACEVCRSRATRRRPISGNINRACTVVNATTVPAVTGTSW